MFLILWRRYRHPGCELEYVRLVAPWYSATRRSGRRSKPAASSSTLDEGLVQPSSVDVRVDARFRVFHNGRYPYIDVRQPMPDLTGTVEVKDGEPFILHPGEFVLGQTLERVTLPNDLVAARGRSSLGRLGLLIHSTAGFVDSGFSGNLTLELSNVANLLDYDLRGHADRADLVHARTGRWHAPTARARRAPSTRGRPSRRRVGFISTSTSRHYSCGVPCGLQAHSRS